ncbi:2-keto-3-deoxygluconate permease [Bartonella apis]|nr:2-keto-3-deoxygluconate permease [Bartonella apis]OLY47298.1 2-keto-3-deoxygluconate permease [Bartonella apis]
MKPPRGKSPKNSVFQLEFEVVSGLAVMCAAVATPVAIAQLNPEFSAVAQSATALVATCVVVSSIIVPIFDRLMGEKYRSQGEDVIILNATIITYDGAIELYHR